jgi:hypothetical protein
MKLEPIHPGLRFTNERNRNDSEAMHWYTARIRGGRKSPRRTDRDGITLALQRTIYADLDMFNSLEEFDCS